MEVGARHPLNSNNPDHRHSWSLHASGDHFSVGSGGYATHFEVGGDGGGNVHHYEVVVLHGADRSTQKLAYVGTEREEMRVNGDVIGTQILPKKATTGNMPHQRIDSIVRERADDVVELPNGTCILSMVAI